MSPLDPRDPRDVFAALVDEQQDGAPAILLVRSHAHQDSVAASLAAECEVYDLRGVTASSPEDLLRAIDTDEAPETLVLIGAPRLDDVADCATILEARRERLPTRVALLFVVLVRNDLPALARGAPSFMSWCRGNVFMASGERGAPVDRATLDRLRSSGEVERDVWSETTLSNLRSTVGHREPAS